MKNIFGLTLFIVGMRIAGFGGAFITDKVIRQKIFDKFKEVLNSERVDM